MLAWSSWLVLLMSGRLAEGKLFAAAVERKAFIGEADSLGSGISSCGGSEVAVWLAFQTGATGLGFWALACWGKTGSAALMVMFMSLVARLFLGEEGAMPRDVPWLGHSGGW